MKIYDLMKSTSRVNNIQNLDAKMGKIASHGGNDDINRGDTLGWSFGNLLKSSNAKDTKLAANGNVRDSLDELELTINKEPSNTIFGENTPNVLPTAKSPTDRLQVDKKASEQFNDILEEVLNEKK